MSPAILLSHLFPSINKTAVLLKGQEEARVVGSLVVKASGNRRRENGFLFHLTDCTVCSEKDQCDFHLWIKKKNKKWLEEWNNMRRNLHAPGWLIFSVTCDCNECHLESSHCSRESRLSASVAAESCTVALRSGALRAGVIISTMFKMLRHTLMSPPFHYWHIWKSFVEQQISLEQTPLLALMLHPARSSLFRVSLWVDAVVLRRIQLSSSVPAALFGEFFSST